MNDNSGKRHLGTPSAKTIETSLGGLLLLTLVCLPYAALMALLADADQFPGDGGGEARMSAGFQEVFAYGSCVATLGLLWLALWCAWRAGGIGDIVMRAVPILLFGAGTAIVAAIADGFEQPGPWSQLIPILLPPVIWSYALWGCLPALIPTLSRPKVDRVAIWSIASISLAMVPLALLNAATYPARLERHHAKLAAANTAAQAAAEQSEQAARANYARLGPNSSLRDYLVAQYRYLSGVDIVAGARHVRTRDQDAIAMLDEGLILDLTDLWRLDLAPTQTLCEAYGRALAEKFGRSQTIVSESSARDAWSFVGLLGSQLPNIQSLRDQNCNLDALIAEIDAQLVWITKSKDPSGAAVNDAAAFYSRWGLSLETVESVRAKLAGLRTAQ